MNYRPKHFQCPVCEEYILAPVKDTRMEGKWIRRKRRCEVCGALLLTREEIVNAVPKKKE